MSPTAERRGFEVFGDGVDIVEVQHCAQTARCKAMMRCRQHSEAKKETKPTAKQAPLDDSV